MKLQVAKYLISKGDVFTNEKLEIFLQSASTQDQNLSSSEGLTTTEKMSAEIRRRQKENHAYKETFTESTN